MISRFEIQLQSLVLRAAIDEHGSLEEEGHGIVNNFHVAKAAGMYMLSYFCPTLYLFHEIWARG
jgi:hypothetical protein